MNWGDGNLARELKRAANSAGFSLDRLLFTFNRAVLSTLGSISNLAIPREIIIPKLQKILPHGEITAMNAAALLCANALRHKHSRYDPVLFLNNFLKLYNARTIEEVCKIEGIDEKSIDRKNLRRYALQSNNRYESLARAKIWCWAKDLGDATRGTVAGRAWGNHQAISIDEVIGLVALYKKPQKDDDVLIEGAGERTYSAFPKNEFLPILREQRKNGHLSETQAGIILCLILHSRELRRDKSSYVTHPMAVADLVRKYGGHYLTDPDDVWKATLVALLHDGGEKSNINLEKDLNDLLPAKVIEAIQAIHKRDNETYFEYLERCANNPLAAVVKLCDMHHNSLDNFKPSSKQEYVYPISALYMEYRIENPDTKISVKDFVVQQGLCSLEQFAVITDFAGDRRKEPVENARKDIGKINIGRTIKDMFASEANSEKQSSTPNANARRKEDAALQP